MIKSILLASAVMISAPVLAQDAPVQETPPAAQEQTPPPAAEQPADAATPAEAPAAAEQPAETAQQPQEATPPAQPAAPAQQPAQTAEQQPAPQQGQQPANAAQIAAVIDQGFPTYDKDADGNLKAEEFSSWMVALRSASEPAFKGESAADKQWLGAALAQADTDKSGGVNKAELKTFLTPAGAS